MTELWFSRARLRDDANISTLAPMLLPENPDERVANGHRLMWSLFALGNDDPRDFLWREDSNGWFYTLSARAPAQDHPLFEVDTPKPFAPTLVPGQQLQFSLRANPTIARPLDSFRTVHRDPSKKPSRKTAHDDVVMRAIRESDDRPTARTEAISSAGRQWLETQGARCGFKLPAAMEIDSLRITGYQILRPQRAKRSNQMRIATLDFDGVLEVTDPVVFLAALKMGFGRAKAYGCGLMMIRRV
jgi:CRISPR system Cascade subunit CasE